MRLHVLGGLAGLLLVICAVQQAGSDPAPEHAQHGFLLLAFHGRACGFICCCYCGREFDIPLGGGAVSHSDLTMGAHPAVAGEIVAVCHSDQEAGHVAVHHCRCGHLRRLPSGLRLPAQRLPQLAHAVQVFPHRGQRHGDDVHPHHQQLDHVSGCARRQERASATAPFAGP